MQYIASFRNSFSKLKKEFLGGKQSFKANETANAYSSPKSAEDSTDYKFDRYGPCYVLWKSDIPAVIWLEDVSVLHGSEIQL